uniref:Uncharacterized protein n=1 Tax=Hydrodictyon reticulatum TaxID=3107 RepID=A0A1W6F7M3_HYDRE|nr:hypothetical protein [Hydrodictyon reticulatum]YP_009364240.1 hypothetical protein [Hydrodictyon reticulatum]ARK36685.1 hypothetical protein [Hydrodictyon reticulatum]ARK36692.1 hypothetical protein [Hydrodictyon reticulatum]
MAAPLARSSAGCALHRLLPSHQHQLRRSRSEEAEKRSVCEEAKAKPKRIAAPLFGFAEPQFRGLRFAMLLRFATLLRYASASSFALPSLFREAEKRRHRLRRSERRKKPMRKSGEQSEWPLRLPAVPRAALRCALHRLRQSESCLVRLRR